MLRFLWFLWTYVSIWVPSTKKKNSNFQNFIYKTCKTFHKTTEKSKSIFQNLSQDPNVNFTIREKCGSRFTCTSSSYWQHIQPWILSQDTDICCSLTNILPKIQHHFRRGREKERERERERDRQRERERVLILHVVVLPLNFHFHHR